jgi:hypothetical protein
MPWNTARIAARIEHIQALYDASGRPPGRVVFRNCAGWWVRTAMGGKYVKLGQKWREVVYLLKVRVK